MKKIFLDYASTTPISPVVRAAMEPYFSDNFYNPSALYLAAKDVKKAIDAARVEVASLLGARPTEIVFTAGTTEANNLALRGVMDRHANAHCIISAIEHDSVLFTSAPYNHSLLPVSEQGIVQLEALKALITDKTVLVSCMLANNEIGTVQPLRELSKILDGVRAERLKSGNELPLYLHSDAAQAYNYMPVLPHSLGVDLLVVGGSKIYGPKQSAVLYVRTGVELSPQITGGGQEWGLRAGTENVPNIIGLAAAMRETAELREVETERLQKVQQLFLSELERNLSQFQLNGSRKHRLPNNVHITLPGSDNETLVMQLDEAGIMAAVGSACSASSDEPSHVLKALGLSDQGAQSSLRFTMGRDTTEADVLRTVKTLTEKVKLAHNA